MVPSVSANKFIVFTLCFFLIFSFLIPVSLSQTNALSVEIIPKYPKPFETVRITIEDYSRDLNKVDISWSLNGKVEKSGQGLKKFQLTVGALGTVSDVSVNMGGIVHRLTLRPAVTDILWQTDTYTPPFYAGKALHSNQSLITFEAEPFFITEGGVRLDPETLVYNWKNNGKLNNSASGYGKRTLKYSSTILLKPVDVSVEVSSTDGVFRSLSSVTVADSETETVFYENHPLYGIIFETALNDKEFLIEGREVNIKAVPYFFSNQQKNFDGLSYDWKLNNSPLDQRDDGIIFRKPEGVAKGRSLVSLTVKNPEKFMQNSSASLYVNYKGDDSENASGQKQNIF